MRSPLLTVLLLTLAAGCSATCPIPNGLRVDAVQQLSGERLLVTMGYRNVLVGADGLALPVTLPDDTRCDGADDELVCLYGDHFTVVTLDGRVRATIPFLPREGIRRFLGRDGDAYLLVVQTLDGVEIHAMRDDGTGEVRATIPRALALRQAGDELYVTEILDQPATVTLLAAYGFDGVRRRDYPDVGIRHNALLMHDGSLYWLDGDAVRRRATDGSELIVVKQERAQAIDIGPTGLFIASGGGVVGSYALDGTRRWLVHPSTPAGEGAELAIRELLTDGGAAIVPTGGTSCENHLLIVRLDGEGRVRWTSLQQ